MGGQPTSTRDPHGAPVSDLGSRLVERDLGVDLAGLRRRGELVCAYSSWATARCPANSKGLSGIPHGWDCQCGGEGWVPFDQEDLLKLLAFLNVPQAQQLIGLDGKTAAEDLPEGEVSVWSVAFDQTRWVGQSWVEHLEKLLDRLPPKSEERPCPRLAKTSPDMFHGVGRESECPQCYGTLRYNYWASATAWLGTAAAVAAARECLLEYTCPWCVDPGGCYECGGSKLVHPRWLGVEAAIEAAEAWVACPTIGLRGEWSRRAFAENGDQTDLPRWVPNPVDPTDAIPEAAIALSHSRVRDLSEAALVKRLLVPSP